MRIFLKRFVKGKSLFQICKVKPKFNLNLILNIFFKNRRFINLKLCASLLLTFLILNTLKTIFNINFTSLRLLLTRMVIHQNKIIVASLTVGGFLNGFSIKFWWRKKNLQMKFWNTTQRIEKVQKLINNIS